MNRTLVHRLTTAAIIILITVVMALSSIVAYYGLDPNDIILATEMNTFNNAVNLAAVTQSCCSCC